MHKDGSTCYHEWPVGAHLYSWVVRFLLPLVAGIIADATWGTIPLGVLPLGFPWAGAAVALVVFAIAHLARPRSLRQ